MKYDVIKLDRRYRMHKWFQWAISFSGRMSLNQGPLHFDAALNWCFRTYGWSAEIRQYEDIREWFGRTNPWLMPSDELSMPDSINPQWSWTNGIKGESRIYLASDKELSFFCIAHPRSR